MIILDDSTATNLKHMIRIAHNSILVIEEQVNLPPDKQELLTSARMCLLQLNRTINLSEFLTNADEAALQKEYQTFEIKNLIEEITNTFYNTLINYVPIDIKISIDLKETTAIIVDKSRFELAVLNLLYCSLKTRNTGKPIPVKLNISVTETHDWVVFRIKDNSTPAQISKTPDKFLISRPSYSIFNDWSLSSLLSLSLKAAQTATEQMDGNITHTTLKSGNRYDIYLPKHRDLVIPLQSIAAYVPTESYFKEIFADFMIEKNLSKVVDALKGLEGMLL